MPPWKTVWKVLPIEGEMPKGQRGSIDYGK